MVAPGWKAVLDGMVAGEPGSFDAVLRVAQLAPTGYGEGWFELVWAPGEAWMLPGQRTVFGGAAASALEFSFGAAIATLLDDGERPAAVRLEQDYVAPVGTGDNYKVIGRAISRAGPMVFCRGEITNAAGQILVLGSGVPG